MLGQQISHNSRKSPSGATAMCVLKGLLSAAPSGSAEVERRVLARSRSHFLCFLRRRSLSPGALAAGRVLHVCTRGGGGVGGMEEKEKSQTRCIS